MCLISVIIAAKQATSKCTGLNRLPIYYAHGFLGSRQGTVKMFSLCSLFSGTSTRKTWRLGHDLMAGRWNYLEAASLAYLGPGLLGQVKRLLHSMVASKESDLNLFTLRLTAPSLNVPGKRTEAPSCLCVAAEVTNCHYCHSLLGEVVPSLPTPNERRLDFTSDRPDKATLWNTWDGRYCCRNLWKTISHR